MGGPAFVCATLSTDFQLFVSEWHCRFCLQKQNVREASLVPQLMSLACDLVGVNSNFQLLKIYITQAAGRPWRAPAMQNTKDHDVQTD